MEEEDLGGLLPLNPYLEGFLAKAKEGDDPQQALPLEPFHDDTTKWVRWRVKQLDTPTWWQELSAVPSQSNIKEFTRQV